MSSPLSFRALARALATHLAETPPDDPRAGEALRSAANALRFEPSDVRPVDTEAAYRRFEQRITQSGRRTSSVASAPVWRRWIVPATLAAVLALLVVGTSVPLRYAFFSRGGSPRTQVYTTARAQRAGINLPDGTTVVLAPESRMFYGIDVDGRRVATLEGQAFFTVTPNPRHPFIVRTGNVTTHVLGTSFSVTRYTSDRIAQVAVVTGKVATRADGHSEESLVVTPGMVAYVSDSSARAERVSDIRAYTSWTEGQLAFDDVPAKTVLATLGRWSGYEFRLSDSTLAAKRVTATFNTATPERTMAALKVLLDVTLTFDGSVVTLTPRRRGQAHDSVPMRNLPGSSDFSTPMEVGK